MKQPRRSRVANKVYAYLLKAIYAFTAHRHNFLRRFWIQVDVKVSQVSGIYSMLQTMKLAIYCYNIIFIASNVEIHARKAKKKQQQRTFQTLSILFLFTLYTFTHMCYMYSYPYSFFSNRTE